MERLGSRFGFARDGVLLLPVWLYLALMSEEFFVGPWLRGYPLICLLSHMVIVPLIDLYATFDHHFRQYGRFEVPGPEA